MDNLDYLVEENFKKWNEALSTGKPEEVALLYLDDAPFLPTLSDKLITDTARRMEYFASFLTKNPQGKIKEQVSISLSDDRYLHTGLYDFSLGPKDLESKDIVKARFTYIWQKEGDVWKILHHHSSVLPE